MIRNASIDDEILSRMKATRGARRHLAELDPARTAHVVIDLQNGFMSEGALLEVPDARKIVPNVNRISRALRSAGGLVVFTRFIFDKNEARYWSAFYDRFLNANRSVRQREVFAPTAHGAALWDGLDRSDADLIVDKTRFSAFVPETSDLQRILQGRGIETLIISGTMTNCCCESTARDAMQLGFDVIFSTDANAALTLAEQSATLLNMATLFAEIASADEIEGALAHATVGQAGDGTPEERSGTGERLRRQGSPKARATENSYKRNKGEAK